MKSVLITLLIAIACDILAFIPWVRWLSIIGFTMSVAVWVIARKLYQYDRGNRFMFWCRNIAIIATFAGVAAVFFSFVVGSLLFGGFGILEY